VTESQLERSALFFYPAQFRRSSLPEKLSCSLSMLKERSRATAIPPHMLRGLYVAGNVRWGLQLVIMAAAEGTEAAFIITNVMSYER